MSPRAKQTDEKLVALLRRGDAVLDALRSMAKEADEAQSALLAEAPSIFEEVDAVVEKLGIGDVVRPALDHMAHGSLGVTERQVRFFATRRDGQRRRP
jgi:hypothetical protein